MAMLNLKASPGSGSGWLIKEDGENDDFVAQLKSTEKKSISIKLQDVQDLFYHAIISHKIPTFIIHFKSEDITLVMFRVEDIKYVFNNDNG